MNRRIISTALVLILVLSACVGALILPHGAESVDGGAATTDGERVFLQGAPVYRGFVMIGGRQYYFDAYGLMQKGGIVGSDREGYTLADENGVCCVSEEIRMAATFIMRSCRGDTLEERMKNGFQFMADVFRYQRTYEHDFTGQDMGALAVEMFTFWRGNCYRYAACFACVAVIAGHRARVVLGTTAGNPHGWVEVLVGKRWLLCDPDAQMAEKLLPDYAAYMMEEHCWQITPMRRFELTINADGVAVWG